MGKMLILVLTIQLITVCVRLARELRKGRSCLSRKPRQLRKRNAKTALEQKPQKGGKRKN